MAFAHRASGLWPRQRTLKLWRGASRMARPARGALFHHNVSQMKRVHKARSEGYKLLEAIGRDMSRDAYPEVMDGGFVQLGKARLPHTPFPSKERTNGVPFQRRPEAGRGHGPTAGQGKTATSASEGSAGEAASFISEGQLTERGRHELERVGRAYDTCVRPTPDRIRISWTAGLVEGLLDPAHLVTDLSLTDGKCLIVTWAWWDGGVRIGPRHTNYDGSACVFEARDMSWTLGSPLVELFDMTTVWAVRHLHLRRVGTWPGRQILHTTFERLTETVSGELCGCGGLRPYEECCEKRDRQRCPIDVAKEFHAFTGGRARRLRIPPLIST